MELSRAQTEDPHQFEASATVTDCTEAEGGLFAVRLSETIFYPEGGGQPADRGRVGEAQLRDCERDAHGEIVHCVDRELEPGNEYQLTVDAERRVDLMQQHTAQHLITAIADDAFGLSTVSFHLGEAYASIDVDADSVSQPTLRELQERVNEEIRRARPVRFEFVDRSEYEQMDVRSRGLPDEHRGEVRIVEIDGLDRNTCGGTHVGNLAEIQSIVLTELEQTRERTRLFYLAGDRVRHRLEECLERERSFNELLSCGRQEHVEAVERTVEEAREASNRVTDYQEEVAAFLAGELVESAEPIVHLHRRETDFSFLNDLARRFRAEAPDRVLLLTAADPLHDPEGIFLVAGPEEWVEEHGPAAADMLDGRGGGPPGIYQGRAEALDRREALIEQFEQTR